MTKGVKVNDSMELLRHKPDRLLSPALLAEIGQQPFNPDYINEYNSSPAVLTVEVDGRQYQVHETNNFNSLLENYFKSYRFIKIGGHLIHRPISFNMKKAFQSDGLPTVMHETGHRYPELCNEAKKVIQKMARQREINNQRTFEAMSQQAKIGNQAVLLSDEERPKARLVLSSFYQAILDTSTELGYADTIDRAYLADSGYPSVEAQRSAH